MWCLKAGRSAELQAISAGFEMCQKSLTNYLKTKRNAFPRFFFISDDELLTMLGSSECECVQEHLIKVILPVFAVFLSPHNYLAVLSNFSACLEGINLRAKGIDYSPRPTTG